MYVHTFEHEGEIWTRGVISSVNGQTDNQTFLMNEIIHVVMKLIVGFHPEVNCLFMIPDFLPILDGRNTTL